jgi:hypothetical protein
MKEGTIMRTLDKLFVVLLASGLVGTPLLRIVGEGIRVNHNETLVRDTGRKTK